MNIYVGNLPYSVTEDEIKEMFTEFGEVTSVNIITDKYSGRSKGFGFVEMSNDEEGDEAIKSLNEVEIKGRKVLVNKARPRTERTQQRRPRY